MSNILTQCVNLTSGEKPVILQKMLEDEPPPYGSRNL